MRVAIVAHQFGLWAPQWLCGSPRFAGQTIFLYFIPFLLLPGWLAYGAISFAQRWMAGYFLFRFLRDEGLATGANALFGALVFSAFLQPSLGDPQGWTLVDGFGVAGVPLLLWSFSRNSSRHGIAKPILAFAGGLLFGLSSFYALAFFCLLAFSWFIWMSPRRDPRFWMAAASFCAGWAAACLPTLLPALSHAAQLQRASWGVDANGGWLAIFLTGTLGLLADNALPLAVAALAWIVIERQRMEMKRLAIAVLVFDMVALVWHAAKVVFGRHMGLFFDFQLDRMNFLLPLAAAMAAAMALESLRQATVAVPRSAGNVVISCDKLLAWTGIAIVLAQTAMANGIMFQQASMGSNYAAMYRAPALERLQALTKTEPPFRVATVGDNAAYVWKYGLESADGYSSVATRRYHDFWQAVIAPVLARDDSRREYVQGYGLRLDLFAPTSGFRDLPVAPADDYNLNLLSLANVRYLISTQPLKEASLNLLQAPAQPVLVWQSLPRHKKYLPYLLGHYAGEPRYVYENEGAFPRFFVADRVETFTSAPALLQQLAESDPSTLQHTALLEREEHLPAPQAGATGSIAVAHYSADHIVLNAQTSGPLVLVIGNAFDPGWHARVNGKPTQVLRADYAFQAVSLPAGASTVELGYSLR